MWFFLLVGEAVEVEVEGVVEGEEEVGGGAPLADVPGGVVCRDLYKGVPYVQAQHRTLQNQVAGKGDHLKIYIKQQ